MSQSCIIIGAGNLATHLALALKKNGHDIVQVYNRSEAPARELAKKVNSEYTTNPYQLKSSASVFFVAVKDDAFDEVLSKIKLNDKLLIHCSGSTPLSALSNYSANYGVLYPLQTFSKDRYLDFNKIPIFIESNSESNLKLMEEIASSLSEKVFELDSEKRKSLHVAAVFACNFVNHLYTLAGDVLQEKEIPFYILKPLIAETAKKIQDLKPFDAQTGPAVRNDEKIIAKHIESLEDSPELLNLYISLSKSIFNHHQK